MPSQEEYLDNLLNDIVASQNAGEKMKQETVEPDIAEPETVEPKTTEPDVVGPETVETEAEEPDAVEPETIELEATEPANEDAEIVEPEVTTPENIESQVIEPEVMNQEIVAPETAETEAAIPEIAEPEVAVPETAETEVVMPEVTEPEITVPEITTPEGMEPDVTDQNVTVPEMTATDIDSPIEVEDTMDMSEDEIEKLLNQSRQESEAQAAEPAEAESKGISDGNMADNTETGSVDDLLGLLNSSDDADLKDIHDMLDKSDRNEAVDDDIISLLQGIPDDDTVSANGEEVDSDNERNMSDIEDLLSDDAEQPLSKKEQKAELCRKKKEEKAAKKQALKEEKAAKKAARIAAKKGAAEESDTAPEAEADTEVNAVSAGDVDLQGETDSQGKTDEDIDMGDIDELLGLVNQGAFDAGASDSDSTAPADEDSVQASPVSAGEHKAALVDAMAAENKPAKKKGFFAKILDALTEEDEEEEPQKENEDIQLSEENKNIIEELDKNKKKKKKKGKKNAEAAETPEGEEGEEAAEKPKKTKRKKKEKAPKTEEEAEQPKGSRLSLKKVLPILLVCLTFGACVVVLANISGEYAVKKEGRKAFYDGDYQTCYQNLYGKELTESEQVMFAKSESILCIRLWLREYEMFAEEGKRAEALDSLIQSVNSYPDLHGYAQQWNAGTEVELMYQQLLDILSEQYNLTEEQALEIAAVKKDVDYSIRVYAIANGEAYGSWDNLQPDTSNGASLPAGDAANGDSAVQDSSAEVLQDALPGEEDFGNAPFIDNISQDGQE